MTVFFYKATDKNGKFIEGDIEAPDYRLAIQRIQNLNYFPIQVSEEQPKKSLAANLKLPGETLRKKVSQKDLMNLTHQLATLVESGLTLDKCLSTLVQLNEKKQIQEVLQDIQDRVHGGSGFADALAEHPNVFSKLYVNMIRAGEVGGTLGPTLFRLADFMEKAEELKSSIRSAMIYPAILTLVGGSAVVVLLTVVIPQFSTIFEEMGQALPLPTKILLGISSAITLYWWALLVLLVLLITLFVLYLKSETGRLQWDGLLLKTPVLGKLIQRVEVSRFSRTMGTLLQSGIPVLQALLIVQSILTNRVIARAMDPIHEGLKSGKGISVPLEQTRVFPPLAVHMITVGEQTGSLDDMLAKVSDTYDREVAQSVKQLISLIEPVMILVMAVIIGFIVISMLLAIFSVNEISF